jgi:hypothetical protein
MALYPISQIIIKDNIVTEMLEIIFSSFLNVNTYFQNYNIEDLFLY